MRPEDGNCAFQFVVGPVLRRRVCVSVVFSLPLMQRCLLMRRQIVLRAFWENHCFPSGVCVVKAP